MSFGPIGDTLLMLAFFDDILRLEPAARFTVLASVNAGTIRELSAAYPSVEIVRIPGPAGLPTFALGLLRRKSTVIVPGVARTYSLKLKLFFWILSLRPGNLVLGFREWSGMRGWLPFDRSFSFDFKKPVMENYRGLIQYILPDSLPSRETAGFQPPRVRLNLQKPSDFPLPPGSYLIVHMFGTRARYSFPPKRWRLLLTELRRRFPSHQLVLTGGAKDETAINRIADGVPGVRTFINRPILEVAGIIHDAAAYIGVDTGITHLAAVQGVKSVVIGHNTDPMWLPYYNPNGSVLTDNTRCLCRGDKSGDCVIYEDSAAYRRCTYDVSVDDVCGAVEEKLRGR